MGVLAVINSYVAPLQFRLPDGSALSWRPRIAPASTASTSLPLAYLAAHSTKSDAGCPLLLCWSAGAAQGLAVFDIDHLPPNSASWATLRRELRQAFPDGLVTASHSGKAKLWLLVESAGGEKADGGLFAAAFNHARALCPALGATLEGRPCVDAAAGVRGGQFLPPETAEALAAWLPTAAPLRVQAALAEAPTARTEAPARVFVARHGEACVEMLEALVPELKDSATWAAWLASSATRLKKGTLVGSTSALPGILGLDPVAVTRALRQLREAGVLRVAVEATPKVSARLFGWSTAALAWQEAEAEEMLATGPDLVRLAAEGESFAVARHLVNASVRGGATGAEAADVVAGWFATHRPESSWRARPGCVSLLVSSWHAFQARGGQAARA